MNNSSIQTREVSKNWISRRWAFSAGFATLLVAILAAAWWLGFLTPEPDPVSFESTADNIAEDQSDSADQEVEQATPIDSISGEWKVTTDKATFVGYRTDTQAGEAVGRSPGVSGSLVATDDVISEVEISADMTQLTSDSSLRDKHLGDRGLEYDIYPEATFSLTEALPIGDVPLDGASSSFTAVGELTVRDMTKPVTIDLEGALVDGTLVIVGSSDISLDDYGASVKDTTEATMEFSLVFTR